jgi:hypothetical protein
MIVKRTSREEFHLKAQAEDWLKRREALPPPPEEDYTRGSQLTSCDQLLWLNVELCDR